MLVPILPWQQPCTQLVYCSFSVLERRCKQCVWYWVTLGRSSCSVVGVSCGLEQPGRRCLFLGPPSRLDTGVSRAFSSSLRVSDAYKVDLDAKYELDLLDIPQCGQVDVCSNVQADLTDISNNCSEFSQWLESQISVYSAEVKSMRSRATQLEASMEAVHRQLWNIGSHLPLPRPIMSSIALPLTLSGEGLQSRAIDGWDTWSPWASLVSTLLFFRYALLWPQLSFTRLYGTHVGRLARSSCSVPLCLKSGREAWRFGSSKQFVSCFINRLWSVFLRSCK